MKAHVATILLVTALALIPLWGCDGRGPRVDRAAPAVPGGAGSADGAKSPQPWEAQPPGDGPAIPRDVADQWRRQARRWGLAAAADAALAVDSMETVSLSDAQRERVLGNCEEVVRTVLRPDMLDEAGEPVISRKVLEPGAGSPYDEPMTVGIVRWPVAGAVRLGGVDLGVAAGWLVRWEVVGAQCRPHHSARQGGSGSCSTAVFPLGRRGPVPSCGREQMP